jgi:hypothetical protein
MNSTTPMIQKLLLFTFTLIAVCLLVIAQIQQLPTRTSLRIIEENTNLDNLQQFVPLQSVDVKIH